MKAVADGGVVIRFGFRGYVGFSGYGKNLVNRPPTF